MEGCIVNLSKVIILDDFENANNLGLGDLYNSCSTELFDTISWPYQKYKNSSNIGLSELNNLSDCLKPFESRLYSKLSSKQLFSINSLYTISLREVLIRIISFDIEKKEFKMALHAISNDVKLFYIIGNNIVISADLQEESDYINTITLDIGKDITIGRVKK